MAEGAPPIYRRDRRRLPAPQRRRQIIDVATQLIADRGFWGVSMQDVADGCGLTVPGLLRHVESKVGLLIAVLEHRDVEDALSLRAHLGATEEEMPLDWATGYPAGVGLRRLCDATMRRNAMQPEIVRLFTVLAAESLAGPPRARLLRPAPAGGDRRLRRAGRTADRSARGTGKTDRCDDGRPADPVAAQPGDHRPSAGVESRCRSPVRPVHRGSAILTTQTPSVGPSSTARTGGGDVAISRPTPLPQTEPWTRNHHLGLTARGSLAHRGPDDGWRMVASARLAFPWGRWWRVVTGSPGRYRML